MQFGCLTQPIWRKIMKINKTIMTITVVLLGPLKVWASPSAYSSTCSPLNINNQTKSTLLSDNQDCNTVWVLPPTSGKTSLSSFTPNGNIRLCQGLKTTEDSSNHIVKSVAKMETSILALGPKLDKAEERLAEALSNIRDYENNPLIKEIKVLKKYKVWGKKILVLFEVFF